MKGVLYCLLLLLLQVSCNKPKDLSLLVSEWDGKEIKFPHGIRYSVLGYDTIGYQILAHEYAIVTYVDSIGVLVVNYSCINGKN